MPTDELIAKMDEAVVAIRNGVAKMEDTKDVRELRAAVETLADSMLELKASR